MLSHDFYVALGQYWQPGLDKTFASTGTTLGRLGFRTWVIMVVGWEIQCKLFSAWWNGVNPGLAFELVRCQNAIDLFYFGYRTRHSAQNCNFKSIGLRMTFFSINIKRGKV